MKKPGAARKATKRSEMVSVRFNPQLRYLADLAARKQRRTLSGFIDWAVEDALSKVYLDFEQKTTVASQAGYLWDIDPADRFAKLAFRFEHLLNHEEQVLWKLVKENAVLWKARYNDGEWNWSTKEDDLILPRLREHWASFNLVARGDATPDILPTREKPGPDPDIRYVRGK